MTGITRRLRPLFVLVALVLVAAACSSSGFPTDYGQQVDEATGLSNVEQNFLEGCVVGRLGEQADATQERRDAADAVCECSYARISSEIPFDEFVAADERLAESPQLLTDPPNGSTEQQIADIIVDCICTTPNTVRGGLGCPQDS